MSRKVVLEAQDIPHHGSGDPLKNRFGHMIEYDGFDVQRPFDKAKPTASLQSRDGCEALSLVC